MTTPSSGQEDGRLPAAKSEVAEKADEPPEVNGFEGTTAKVRDTQEAHRDPQQGSWLSPWNGIWDPTTYSPNVMLICVQGK